MASKKSIAATTDGLVNMVAHRLARVELGKPALGDLLTADHVDEARALVRRGLRLMKTEIADKVCPLPEGVEEPILVVTDC